MDKLKLFIPIAYLFNFKYTLSLNHGILDQVENNPLEGCRGGLGTSGIQVKDDLEHTAL